MVLVICTRKIFWASETKLLRSFLMEWSLCRYDSIIFWVMISSIIVCCYKDYYCSIHRSFLLIITKIWYDLSHFHAHYDGRSTFWPYFPASLPWMTNIFILLWTGGIISCFLRLVDGSRCWCYLASKTPRKVIKMPKRVNWQHQIEYWDTNHIWRSMFDIVKWVT